MVSEGRYLVAAGEQRDAVVQILLFYKQYYLKEHVNKRFSFFL